MKMFDPANRKTVGITEAFTMKMGEYLNINRNTPILLLGLAEKNHEITDWGDEADAGKATFTLQISEIDGNMRVTKRDFYNRCDVILEDLEIGLMKDMNGGDFEMDDEFDDVEELGEPVVDELNLIARYEAYRDLAGELIDQAMSDYSTGDTPIKIYNRSGDLLVQYPITPSPEEPSLKNELRKLRRYMIILNADNSFTRYSAMDAYTMIDPQAIAKANWEFKALYRFGKLQALSNLLSDCGTGRLTLRGTDRFVQFVDNPSKGVLWDYSTARYQEFDSEDDFPEWVKE